MRLRHWDGHESKVEDDSARILGNWARDSSIVDWTIGPYDIHLSGSQVSVLAGLVLIGNEGTHEADFEIWGVRFEIELSQDGSHISDILVLIKVERSILVLSILTDEGVSGWVCEIERANGDIGVFDLVRTVAKTQPEPWVIRGPLRDIVIFNYQSGVESIRQRRFILEYSILDLV